jgi:ribonuclease VapC
LIVVDSSAVIAIIFQEPEAGALAARISETPFGQRFMSAADYVEAGTVLAGRRSDPMTAVSRLDEFLGSAGVTLTPVDENQARIALEARIRFGRGFGTRAKLNYADSFAYALAKSLRAPLLYVGDDFAATDVEPALTGR